jgi:hypothetical protein
MGTSHEIVEASIAVVASPAAGQNENLSLSQAGSLPGSRCIKPEFLDIVLQPSLKIAGRIHSSRFLAGTGLKRYNTTNMMGCQAWKERRCLFEDMKVMWLQAA